MFTKNLYNLVDFYALGEIQNTIIKDWLGPIFFIAVAVFAIVFIKDRAWMKLIGFIGIATVVGLLVFGSESIFGPGGTGPEIGNGIANQIETK